MIGFKQYTIASFEYLIGERIKNYFLFYYGPRILLYVEDRDFFYENDELISLERGAQKTYDLYRNNTRVLYPEDTSFDFGTISDETRPYYEFAADYLKQNDRVVSIKTPNPNVSISPLREIFFQELYKFKLQISLDITALPESERKIISKFLNYLKKPTESPLKIAADESEYDLQLRTVISDPITNLSVSAIDKFEADAGNKSGPCCSFEDKLPIQPSVASPEFPIFPEPSRFNATFSAETTALDAKLFKINEASAGPGTDEKLIFVTLESMNVAERCYMCKRLKDYKGPKSMLAVIEDELSDSELDQAYNILDCQKFGWNTRRGKIKGSKIKKGSAAALKCQKQYDSQQSDKGDVSNIGEVANSNSDYRNLLLRSAVNNTNDIIDQNLISVVDGE